MEWVSTQDKTHPDKPGLKRYEQIPCLIVKNNEILLRQWNCEHLVWDGEDGDDFYCKAEDVAYWMIVPELPSNKGKNMSLVDKALQALDKDERETYVCFLRDVVKGGPSVGGYGQYLGSIAPLIFATEAEKSEALRRMSEHAF